MPVEVFVRKLFALDINLLAIEGKFATAKTQFIRKIFSTVNGFGGATIFSKFEEIIQSTFTSEKNMEKTASLAREKEININSNLKKQGIRSDWAVVIKKILIDTSKEIIVTAVSEFGDIKLNKIQLIGMWQKAVAKQLASRWSFLIGKDSVHVAMAFRTLLFTLPIGITAHNWTLFWKELSENTMESAYHTELIFGGIKLFWVRLNLVHCERCGFLGHSALKCGIPLAFTPKPLKVVRRVILEEHCLQLVKLYVKKTVSIFCSATFGGKSWAQVMSLNSSFDSSPLYMVFSMFFGSGLSSGARIFLIISASLGDSALHNCLSSLEHSLKLLADQVSDILRKLSNIKLVPLAFLPFVPPPVASTSLVVDMDLDDTLIYPIPFLVIVTNTVADISLSSSKVLTTKVEGLEFKIVTLKVLIDDLVWKFVMCNVRGINVLVKQEDIVFWHKESGNMVSIVTETKLRSNVRPWIMNKFNGIAIIMNSSLARHVSKVDEIPGQLISICLLFKDKLSVTILGLYAGASADTCFGQAFFINSLIFRAANSSSFMVINGDFNKNRSKRSTSFKFCSDLGLVNTFNGHFLAKASTWSNSRGIEKVLDFIFVSKYLAFTIILHKINDVLGFFETDYKTISVVIGLKGLLNAHLNSSNMFKGAKYNDNLDTMWVVLKDIIIQAADVVFSRYWYSAFDCSKNKQFLKFFKLELLIAKIVKAWVSEDLVNFDCLIRVSKTANMVLVGMNSMEVVKHLSIVKKKYQKSKYLELKASKDATIKKVIDWHMNNFCFNKRLMIKSILDHPFRKIVLDYLVVNNELVVESDEVKLKVDEIMER
ncbi:hypothetical protein G9A89_006043 [Geosiphon pyriformis]|nr:hypothetical protein G9A89_006043 [Geosiphon pyriformis]